MNNYEPVYAVPAEGYRIGLAACTRCGAVVLFAEGSDSVMKHELWHDERDQEAAS